MNRPMILSVLMLLASCDGGLQPYYGDGVGPTLSKVSPDSENGNIGGGTAVITGSGFGSDPAGVMVLFGVNNARILDISDSELTVEVPSGPIAGGDVPVTVATATGLSTSTYTYDLNDNADGDPTAYKQIGYVQVNNFWESCYGGLSNRLDETYGGIGCTDFAYMGWTGTDGAAEGYNFSYPSLQSSLYGFFGGIDVGTDTWKIERPAVSGYAAGIDDLRQDLGRVYLENDYFDNDDICVDMGPVTAYQLGNRVKYGNGDTDPGLPTVVDCDKDEGKEPGVLTYRGDRMEFCAPADAVGVPTWSYVADWPIADNFFRAEKEPGFQGEPMDDVVPSEVKLTVEGAGIEDVKLDLPESLIVYADQGFNELIEGTPTPDLWSLATFSGCLDDDDREGESLEDVGFSFYWTPSEVNYTNVEDCGDACEPGDVVAVETFVRITINQLPLGWFGGNGLATRAVITVPDSYETERLDGTEVSRVDVPAWVLYQFPTTTIPSATTTGGASPTAVGKGYMVITVDRITNYSVFGQLADGTRGVVAMSYVTGDFGFYDWNNPLELSCE